MISLPRHTLLQHLHRLIGRPGPAGVSDRQLLERFLTDRDEAAFELLVWRHGPMVFNVCGRVLRNEADAEDAFQATFLKLARKAGAIANLDSISSWLYKVALRTALRTRTQAAGRAGREQPMDELPAPDDVPGPADQAAWRELGPVLDAEVRRLPSKYRDVVILCCLQGLSNEQAALELGCPKGTVLSRLARARERLRRRLSRRGLAVGLLPLAFLAVRCGERVLSPELVAATVRAVASALHGGSGQAAGHGWTVASPKVMLLAVAALLMLGLTGTAALYCLPPPSTDSTGGAGAGAGCSSGCCHGGSTQPTTSTGACESPGEK